jgi:hypothetical protein
LRSRVPAGDAAAGKNDVTICSGPSDIHRGVETEAAVSSGDYYG